MAMLKLLALDRFTILLVGMVLLATFFPVSGQAAQYFNTLTTVAIAILFFLHGAKLSREAVIEGILHWKMHVLVFAFTFLIFPVIGLLAKPILLPLLGQQLYWGFLFMCFLPSTVQSSIAFTSVAKGNVAGAVCSASFSNLIGMFITPVLVSFFILGQSQHGFDPTTSIIQITLLLLVPFILGQLLRPYIFPYMAKVPSIVKAFDQGSILMVVYGAFSGAVVAGLWHQVSWKTLLILTIACSVLLTVIMLLALYLPRALGFNRADQVTVFFCSSKKTLASGVPMAQILFIGQPLGMIVLPIMIFHQIQLMVCGVIANYWAKSKD
ncbi:MULTISPECIES: bile acid:sodium symporter family protein [Acinetobacter calcoaceticus/baumannii complex]|uniref:bile acid:sodium symporter family protein n=1 Tax=Acinetobacter calcoaceticus/baumannii complex TaxID=909768 RepID=UPI0009B82175|nr:MULTISPECIES: bile acid:sodium symporter family protein [Acinetobacter calcoaceticus/baumannii complex]MCE6236042.1 bile acid:sodium symporter [Acinetobacter pittii]MCE6690757.1 bile acid:sodium symporter [Acinetobacter pittii]MCE6698209.1 bile acid:sodium symporter [Acinetobacter pittii]MDE4038881.1 bile acid:sodium symporter [Acinetobacter pittii]WVH56908.1 bile acid:sodium symporter family protein [Acinetobacter pittii]